MNVNKLTSLDGLNIIVKTNDYERRSCDKYINKTYNLNTHNNDNKNNIDFEHRINNNLEHKNKHNFKCLHKKKIVHVNGINSNINTKINDNINDENDNDMSILKHFPYIKTSYDKLINNKINVELYSIIPKGNKYYIWINNFNEYKENICLLMSISKNGTIQNIKKYSLCFDSCLTHSLGTILYGTCFHIKNQKHFSCENIYYYKGKKIDTLNCISKLEILQQMFSNYIKTLVYSQQSIVIGLPIYTNDFDDAFNLINKLPYNVYGIRYHTYNSIWSHGIFPVKNISECVFKVIPTIQQDIYELHCNEGIYSIAFIPDYKTSVMMNKLFRNIKENDNLDLLEESDDENEFEDNREDKYVYLDKIHYMKCIFNARFKKWQPTEIITNNLNLYSKKEIYNLEQQY